MAFNQPIIRWAGSKRKLLPRLLENLPDEINRYIEPFCGSACLFFEISPKRAILSDINEELINALNHIKKNNEVHEALKEIPVSKSEYYRLRDHVCLKEMSDFERAIRFLYLNRFCFNGVYRTNKKGKFNVPMGKNTGNIPSREAFDKAQRKLKRARLITCDYERVLNFLEEGDFVYLDPPYAKAGQFTGEYGLGSFDSDSIPKIVNFVSECDSMKVNFLLSYRASEELTSKLKDKYQVIKLSVKRHISGFKTSWSEADEILIKNY